MRISCAMGSTRRGGAAAPKSRPLLPRLPVQAPAHPGNPVEYPGRREGIKPVLAPFCRTGHVVHYSLVVHRPLFVAFPVWVWAIVPHARGQEPLDALDLPDCCRRQAGIRARIARPKPGGQGILACRRLWLGKPLQAAVYPGAGPVIVARVRVPGQADGHPGVAVHVEHAGHANLSSHGTMAISSPPGDIPMARAVARRHALPARPLDQDG